MNYIGIYLERLKKLIQEQTKLKTIAEAIKNFKWFWAGLLAHLEDNCWTMKSTKWTLLEKRNQEKLKMEW